MKRDMDLVRAILFVVEEHPEGFAPREIKIDLYTDERIAYHAYIMNEARLVVATDTTHLGSTSPQAMVIRLTWAGHEFLDSAREPARWQKAKEIIKKVGGASIAVWTAVLTDLVQKNLGL